MAEAVKRDNHNEVVIEGYLKETTLQVTKKDGINVISGTITVSHNPNTDYRLRFYVTEFAKSDTNQSNPLQSYKMLSGLLPNVSTSIASLLKSNPNAKFDDVKGAATAVWARGSFDVYDRKDENGTIHTSLSLRGMRAGVKSAASGHFELKAGFEIDGIVEKVYPEVNKEGQETGRTIIKLSSVDNYNKVSFPIELVAETPNARQEATMWQVGESGCFFGVLRSTQEETVDASSSIQMRDGTVETKKVTRWVNERIMERSSMAFTESQVTRYISPELIKEYKINREKKLAELPVGDSKKNDGVQMRTPNASASPVAPPSASATANFKNFAL